MTITPEKKTLETGQERRAMVTFPKTVCKIPSTQLPSVYDPLQHRTSQSKGSNVTFNKSNTFIYSARVELAVFLLKAKIMTYKLCLQPQALFLLADAKSRSGLTVQSVDNNSLSGNVVAKAETQKQGPRTTTSTNQTRILTQKGTVPHRKILSSPSLYSHFNVLNTHLSFVTVRHSLSSSNLCKSKDCIRNSFRPLRHI